METQDVKQKLAGLVIRGLALLLSVLAFTAIAAKYVVPNIPF